MWNLNKKLNYTSNSSIFKSEKYKFISSYKMCFYIMFVELKVFVVKRIYKRQLTFFVYFKQFQYILRVIEKLNYYKNIHFSKCIIF